MLWLAADALSESDAQRLWQFSCTFAQSHTNRHGYHDTAANGNLYFHLGPNSDRYIHRNFYPNKDACSGYSYPQPGFFV